VVAGQVAEVLQTVPTGLELLLGWLRENPYGRQFLEQARGMNVAGATGWATSVVTGTVSSITSGLGYTVITLFVAIYLAAQPGRYRRLCLRLVPPANRVTVEHLFDVIGDILERWLVGQLVVMCTIGLLTGVGLWLLGIEAAFALGLMGGLLCFIPFVGAILAAVPATLVALTQGPIYAASVILMYVGVHFIEGNFITPMVQAEATSLPPVLAILSTVAFSLLFGPSGVLLAAPLTLLLMVAVEVLYVQEGLGEAPVDEVSPPV
jgi:predicted PurR-regulated permease PerM